MNKIIKSKKFILRPYRKGDEESLIKNINDKVIYRYTCNIPYPYKQKDAKQWIARCKKRNKKKTEINFAIDINRKVVGGAGFLNIENHKAEIGYWLGKKYWGKGIVTEAVKLVTNFGFKKLHLKRIYATVFLKNKASARVLEKNGYKREGIMRKFHLKDGKFLDAILYAKVK
ncbi:MAG: GNAT family protein [Candidatus Woesearchaeota archaeon]